MPGARLAELVSMSERGLQVDQDLGFQFKEWRVQIAGRVVFAVVVLAALGGLFGEGPLSSARSASANAAVEYERFGRVERGLEYRFFLPATDRRASLTLSREFFERVTISNWEPEPSQQIVTGAGASFIFDSEAPTAEVVLIGEPRHAGIVRARASSQGEELPMWQFVYP